MGTAKFTRIDNEIFTEWLPEIGYRGAIVYAYVSYRTNRKRRTGCFESVDNMAKSLKMDRRTLRLKLKQLVDVGLLARQRRKHKTTIYRPTPIPQKDKNAPLKNEVQKDKNGLLKNLQKEHFARSKGQKRPTNKTKITRTSKDGATAPDLLKAFKRKWETKYDDVYPVEWKKEGAMLKSKMQSISAPAILQKLDAFLGGWWDRFWKSKNGTLRPTVGDFVGNLARIPSTRDGPSYEGTPSDQL